MDGVEESVAKTRRGEDDDIIHATFVPCYPEQVIRGRVVCRKQELSERERRMQLAKLLRDAPRTPLKVAPRHRLGESKGMRT